MKLSLAQRSLLLAMHGGAKVWYEAAWRSTPEHFRISDGDEKCTRVANSLIGKGLALPPVSYTRCGYLTLTPAGRELAQRLSEGATDEAK